jgi:hypothetical protein
MIDRVRVNRVRVNARYIYSPNLLDKIDGRTALEDGQMVRVINLHGCPPARTMGHCYVQDMHGRFMGLVHCNSLHTLAAWKAFGLRKNELGKATV